MPLTLTILSHAFPSEKRGIALGIWGAVGGIGVASGPLVGGVVIEEISWQWIFWLNVPVGLAVLPFAVARLRESHGPTAGSTCPAWPWSAPGCSGSSGASCTATRTAGGAPGSWRR